MTDLFPITVFIAVLLFIIDRCGLFLADAITKLTFRVASFGLPRDSRELWRDEVLHHMLEEVFNDTKRGELRGVVLLLAVARCASFALALPSERGHYRQLSSSPLSGFDRYDVAAVITILNFTVSPLIALTAAARDGVSTLDGVLLIVMTITGMLVARSILRLLLDRRAKRRDGRKTS